MDIEKILICGIDTLAGSNLALAWAGQCELIGLSRRRNFLISGCQMIDAGSGSTAEIGKSIADAQPQAIVYCGPSSSSSWDWTGEFDSAAEARQVAAVWQAAQNCGSSLTLISSDAACHGPQVFHREKSPTMAHHPATAKVREIEKVLNGTQSLVVRTHLFGFGPGEPSWGERLWDAIDEGRPVIASGSRYATPIFAGDFADLLWRAIAQRLHGTYHLAGAERVNMWQFATALAAVAGTTVKVLQTISPSESESPSINSLWQQIEETSLDSRHIQRTIKMAMPLLRDGMSRFVEQAANGKRDRSSAALTTPAVESAAA